MNPFVILRWLRDDAERHHASFDGAAILREQGKSPTDKRVLEEILWEVNNRRQLDLPDELPDDEDALVAILRKHFKDKVTPISLVLSQFLPERYLYFRHSTLEDEILAGLAFIYEDSDFEPIDTIGQRGFENYLRFNERVMKLGEALWPDVENRQSRLLWLVYRGLGDLFRVADYTSRYWFMCTRDPYWHQLDSDEDICWSGRKEMRAGDVVFMYRTKPRSAVTNVYQVIAEPTFDPWGAWEGFWVELQSLGAIPDVPFQALRDDDTLAEWAPLRKKLQGVVTEQLPNAAYNAMLEYVPHTEREAYGLEPEPVLSVGRSGEYVSEAEFEDEVIAPLLNRWSFKFKRQAPCNFRLGSQTTRCRVDFLVSDAHGPLTLFESKVRIVNDNELLDAFEQARSYALQLELLSFVVAAPEGLWIYQLVGGRAELVREVAPDELESDDEAIRDLLVALGK